MDPMKYEELAEKLKVLGHPVRLCIICGIMEKQCHVNEICKEVGVPQPVISLHLAKLKAAGIVSGTRQGHHIHYEIIDQTVVRIIKLIDQ